MSNKSIQWILNQLANDEASMERFNKLTELKIGIYSGNYNTIVFMGDMQFAHLSEMGLKEFIRTALSRYDGQAVISALEGENPEYFRLHDAENHPYDEISLGFILPPKTKSEALYLTFDEPLRQGKPLTEAFEALDKKFEELKII